MAKAYVTRQKKYPAMTLELEPDEVEFLHRLLGRHITGGSFTWRGCSDSIVSEMYRKLGEMGIDCKPFSGVTTLHFTKKD